MADANETDANKLVANPGLMDEMNQAVIKEFRANKGNVSGQFQGMPIVLITMTGAKTGRTLVRPVCYSRDGDRVVVIASYGGAKHNPPWYHNLMAHPQVTVEVGSEKYTARVTKAEGAERQRLFDAQAKLMPFFNDYQKKAPRQIPVLTLTRVN